MGLACEVEEQVHESERRLGSDDVSAAEPLTPPHSSDPRDELDQEHRRCIATAIPASNARVRLRLGETLRQHA